VSAGLAAALGRALGRDVARLDPVAGGDLNDAYAATLADGTRVFVKTSGDAAPDGFAAEAAGLRWLAEPHALPLPTVLAVEDAAAAPRFLALAWIDAGPPTPASDEALGRGLAALHTAGAPAFGGPSDTLHIARSRSPTNPPTTGLFGGPSERCFAAYEEVAPLAAGAADRVPLWQLAPLLLHAALFGAAWGLRVTAALRSYA
jgi:fructosamine-3-kinase